MKQRNKYSALALLFLGLALCVIWLGFSEKTGQSEPKKIVLIPKVIDETNDFWTAISNGAAMAAKEYNVELTILGTDAETKYEEQGKLIQEAIDMKPDAIALAPCNYVETQKYAKSIEDAGILLVLVDSVMEEPMGKCVIATDNYEGGFQMGEYMSRFVTEDTVIGIVGHVKGSSTATEREAGFRAGLGENAEKIVDVVFCDSDFSRAYQVTGEMIRKYPKINMIAGLNEYSSVGAARAVVDMKLSDSIRMIGFDSSKEEVQLLESGIFEAIVVQKPLNMGYLGIEKAVQALNRENIPELVDSGSVLITKETMYTEENQKLLFPL